MSSTSYKHRSSRKRKAKKGSARFVYLIIALAFISLVIGGFALRSSQTTQASTSQYAGIPGPNDWTDETAVQIYNRSNGQWEPKTYDDVGPDMEFIVGNYLYATTPEKGSLFLKPEIDITLLAETDRAFDPDNWRMPKPDDVVFLFRSSSNQQKGHWLLKHVQPDSEVVFQGKVWKWELDVENQRFVVSDTGNVFARVTETHVNFHEGDVLALTVRFDSCGKTDIITGSEEHPFYVLDVEDYVPMVDLQPDMRLKTDNGSLATVVELKPLDESMELYNLTVEHVQNYYIFTSEDDPGVLVHNTGPCWGFWDDLPKVTHGGREYAEINGRYYTREAIDRMTPSGYGTAAGGYAGRGIPPSVVEDVIVNGTPQNVMRNGVQRTLFELDGMRVVTEQNGQIIITAYRFK